MLDNVPGARERAERGELLFGTVETWLIWQSHRRRPPMSPTTPTPRRTMLFDIHTLCWDEELCRLLGIPHAPAPAPAFPTARSTARSCPASRGWRRSRAFRSAARRAISSRRSSGRAATNAGEAKNTYGTGCFTLMNVGGRAVRSRAGLVTSVAWSLGGKTIYALEGSVFNAGSAIQWLRDELGLIGTSHECDLLAESVPDAGGVYLVPAFTGLGAPYWDMYARGCIVGVTRGTTRAHIARAVLEAIAFEVTDLMNAMRQDAGCEITVLRVDGGASVSDVMLRFQSDLLRIPVDRPKMVETTAFGAAALAGLAVGFWQSTDEVRALRVSDRVFSPERAQAECDEKYRLWKRAVSCACGWIEKA